MQQKTILALFALISIVLNTSALPVHKKKLRFGKGFLARMKADMLANGSVITVTEGEHISIPCKADGTRTPVFHWLFNDEYIEQGPLDTVATNLISPKHSLYNTVVKANLYISHAKMEHAGTYTCIADSLTKRVTSSFTVKVEKKATPAESDVKKDGKDAPMIYQWTSSIMQVEGTTLYVVCRATQGHTSAAPKVRWTINDPESGEILRDITEDEHIKVHSNGDLEVRNVGSDFHFKKGELRCTAINDDGTRVEHKGVFVYILLKGSESKGTRS